MLLWNIAGCTVAEAALAAEPAAQVAKEAFGALAIQAAGAAQEAAHVTLVPRR